MEDKITIKQPEPSGVVEDQTKKILHERAIDLAKELEGNSESESLTVLEFQLANESYCLKTTTIKEVYQLKDYTQVPCTPNFIFGVINFHGQILSIIDLKKVFNLSSDGINDQNKIIVLESRDMTYGIMTDKILGIIDIEESSIQKEAPLAINMKKSNYISGITTDGRIILDSEALLSDPNMIVNEIM